MKLLFGYAVIALFCLAGCMESPDPVIGCWKTESGETGMSFGWDGTYYYPVEFGRETKRWVLMPPKGTWKRIDSNSVEVTYKSKVGGEVKAVIIFENETIAYFEDYDSVRFYRKTRAPCG